MELANHRRSSGSKPVWNRNKAAAAEFRSDNFVRTATMAIADQLKRYHRYASECIRLAQQAKTSQEKNLLLQMAQTWRRLAERVESLHKPESGDDGA
jgi:hypothetical protein